MKRRLISWQEAADAASALHDRIKDEPGQFRFNVKVYGVPRGGANAAQLLQAVAANSHQLRIGLVDNPGEADVIVDDLYDSGATARRYAEMVGKPFYCLFTKNPESRGVNLPPDEWVVFPWEHSDPTSATDSDDDASAHDVVTRMLQRIGEDVDREGLAETPARVVKAWRTWFGGYGQNPADVLKVFEDGAEGVDEMVLETDIPVYSFCEHHLAPIFGVAHVAYIPNGKVVGLSKLVRLVDVFARRLQVQERLTNNVADALMEHLDAKGAGVIMQCRHMCMESRGICAHGVVTTTSALRGAMKEEHDARAEFLSLVSMSKSPHNPIL